MEPLAEDQGTLGEKVSGLIQKLEEEGARVFRFMLENISSDMNQIKEQLLELETGQFTQFLQKEVLGSLDQLKDDLRHGNIGPERKKLEALVRPA